MANLLLPSSVNIILVLLFLSTPTVVYSSQPILDVDGNPLEAGSQYYVLTSGRGAAGRGGLLAAPDLYDGICPLYVGQYKSWTKQGSPVRFLPADPSQKHITQGSDVNIAFEPSHVCNNQGLWQVGTTTGRIFYITTNGVIENPGSAASSTSLFRVEQASGIGGSYKIVYCNALPVPARSAAQTQSSDNCQQLGVYVPGPPGSDWRWFSLVPIDEPLSFFGFEFKKVTLSSM